MKPPDSFYLIENTAQEFWALAGGTGGFPRDIKTAITMALPLEVYPVRALRVGHILDWTRRVKITHRISGRDRRLHGCLLVDRSKGTIFVDASETDEEQRFTLAHELAHFLLDYQQPRLRALNALGPSILPVLDGQRTPTVEERVHAIISGVPLGAMSHFMERPESGLPTNLIIDIENRADRLALELLAPAQSLYACVQRATAPKGFDTRLIYLTRILTQEYGLPAAIGSSYSRSILTELGEPTFRNWLFGLS